MSDFRQQRSKNILDHWGLKLTTAPVQGSQRRPSLAFRFIGNDPVAEAWTNVQGDKDNGRILLKLDNTAFEALMQALEYILKSKEQTHIAVEVMQRTWNGGKPGDIKPAGRLAVGRDSNGVMFVAITSWDQNRPKLRFPLLPNERDFNFYDASGQPLEKSKLSELVAGGWLSRMRSMMPTIQFHTYTEPQPKEKKGGGQSGGYQNNQNPQSQSAPDTGFSDDDFSF